VTIKRLLEKDMVSFVANCTILLTSVFELVVLNGYVISMFLVWV